MDAVYWTVIIIADLFSILLGGYSLYQVIDAFLNSKDLMKYQGQLFTAVFAIVLVPMIITYGGMAIYGSEMVVGLEVEANSGSKVSLDSNSYKLRDDETIELQIDNKYKREKEFEIEISCAEGKDCESDMLLPEKEQIKVDPKVTFKLPVEVNIKDKPKGALNISVKEETGKIYDSLKLNVN